MATDTSININRSRIKEGKYPNLEKRIVLWIKDAVQDNTPLSSIIIKNQSMKFAKEMNINEFQSSNGWFSNFKSRNQLIYKAIRGEAKGVNLDICENWKQNVFVRIMNEYEEKDIFNADETGLAYKVIPNKTFTFKEDKSCETKIKKERVTVLPCANLNGTEKLKPLVIQESTMFFRNKIYTSNI